MILEMADDNNNQELFNEKVLKKFEHSNIIDLSKSKNLLYVGLDAITFTLSEEEAKVLVNQSILFEHGFQKQGFKRSERRSLVGTLCWRRWKPHQKSKKYGKEYESWQFSGNGANDALKYFEELDIKPTRVDIAFDYYCEEYETTSYLKNLAKDRLPQWLTAYDTGKPDKKTFYLPNVKVLSFLRIYRKDIESKVYKHLFDRPIMRFELQLRDSYAEDVWPHLRLGKVSDVAAHIIHEHSGLKLSENFIACEKLNNYQSVDYAQRFVNILKQYYATLILWDDVDIKFLDHARFMIEFQSKASRSKNNRLKEHILEIGSDNINEEIDKLIVEIKKEREEQHVKELPKLKNSKRKKKKNIKAFRDHLKNVAQKDKKKK